MKNLTTLLIFIPMILACNSNSDLNNEIVKGNNMLLIGNSFFRPYAENLESAAIESGYLNHNSTLIFRGGENGRPINFWNDDNSSEHIQIKAALDQGNIDIFGMTAGHDPENRTEGHRNWIEYARQNNPGIIIFIAIPPIDFPADWTELAQEYGFNTIQELYNYFVNVAQQEVKSEVLLPLVYENIERLKTGKLYEPSKDELVKSLIPRHLNVQMWKYLLESYASEQAARMVAMENATSNSEDMIKGLQLEFNKARQASITTEMLEIVSGAEALKG